MKSRLDNFYQLFYTSNGQWLLNSALMVLFFNGGLLLLSEQTLQELRLSSWVETNRTLLALTVLFISSGILAKLVGIAIKLASDQMASNFRQQKARAKLEMLDNDERALLREFFLRRSSSLLLPQHHPVVQRLAESHVLVSTASDSSDDEGIRNAFSISTEARPFITSNRLRLPVHQLTEEDIRYLKATRPSFIQAGTEQNRAA